MSADFDNVRLIEALLFASSEPLAPAQLARFLPEDTDLDAILSDLETLYANRGVNLVKRGGRWAFRTAVDLAPRMELETKVVRKLSRVALETLAVIAYHQPVTRGEIEEIRGVALSKGTLDTLLEIGWIRPKGRRKTPGRPVTWGTSEAFLDHFGLESLDALPGAEELKAAGLLDSRPAITALGDRGLLPGVGEVAPEAADEDEEDDSEGGEDSLAEGDEGVLDPAFGENLLPQEVDLAALSAEAQHGAQADDPAADEQTGVEEAGAEPDDQNAEAGAADNTGPSDPEEHDPEEDGRADDEVGELVDLNAEGAKRGHG
ncbi:MAG TPA: SMC-Scp complex subunit ScpB [Kiloniellaceae bacterium]|nr:SMC-Scp complex subunit ScpB [Kiloniellaceae bacterium]HIP79283.1 SMC-Scp complex subunit ScpB [Kiloniellaceae bacterium]